MHNGYPALSCIALSPHCCVPENCMGLGQIVQGFLQILLSSKTNEDNKDKWFHLTHWQPHLYVLVLFFASFEILSQGKFSHFCLLWEGLCCGRMCLCNRTTMPWFPPNLKFSFTLRGASSKFQHFLKLLVPTFLQLNKSILFSLFCFKSGFEF